MNSHLHTFVTHSGYSAIIIHNVGSDDAMPMGGDGGNVVIPAVSVGEFTASDLIRYSFHNNPRYTIVLTGNINPVPLLFFCLRRN